jgi:hypothetical protein
LHNLLTKQELIPIYVPFSSGNYFQKDSSLVQCTLLSSKDFPTNPKCLILIQVVGHVTLGEWANSVFVNEGLKLGAMIPFVEDAKKKDFQYL